jgi:cytochrome c-type protein NapB
VFVAAGAWAPACGPSDGSPPRSTSQRAAGRAYDGAPPTIPHDVSSLTACVACHDEDGTAIPAVGVAPASPHAPSAMAGSMSRCRQCHAAAATTSLFVESRFVGLVQGPWRGERATPGAPPTIPHPLLLRDNCLACHAGPAARAEIRSSHPERERCQQCHVLSGV